MNILFKYLYRDAGNFKKFNEIVFDNPNNLDVKDVIDKIQSKLIDATWFYASMARVPDMHFVEFKYNDELDVAWHEFEVCEETCEESNDFFLRDIEAFIDELRAPMY
ncbi:hypothetical protein FACS189441_3040 [Betaproteobacteria bacterium]|nr:hypothetical protein FACS189441_3040 [Betaproteobacteria bacterium]